MEFQRFDVAVSSSQERDVDEKINLFWYFVSLFSNKLSALQNQFSSTKKRLDEAATEKDRLRTEVHQLIGEKEELSELNRRIEGEKSQLEKTIKGYRTETQSMLDDYTQACSQLQELREEKKNVQEAFAKCNQELSHHRERSRLLEVQRKEVQEQLLHMDEQVGERERMVEEV